MDMDSRIKKKQIRSLTQKKYRDRWSMFVAEGPRLVNDLLKAGMMPQLVLTSDLQTIGNPDLIENIQIITDEELKKVSLLKTPQKIVAVFDKPLWPLSHKRPDNDLTLCLDGIQDPGNLGTIMRLADWFGLSPIVCSPDTADVFNPKVVQASMGAVARVQVIYAPLASFCRKVNEEQNLPVFGTFMEGENIYTTPLPEKALIIMGNEGVGIRPEAAAVVTRRITIPAFAQHRDAVPESLNVAVAAAIVCSEFKRQIFSVLTQNKR